MCTHICTGYARKVEQENRRTFLQQNGLSGYIWGAHTGGAYAVPREIVFNTGFTCRSDSNYWSSWTFTISEESSVETNDCGQQITFGLCLRLTDAL